MEKIIGNVIFILFIAGSIFFAIAMQAKRKKPEKVVAPKKPAATAHEAADKHADHAGDDHARGHGGGKLAKIWKSLTGIGGMIVKGIVIAFVALIVLFGIIIPLYHSHYGFDLQAEVGKKSEILEIGLNKKVTVDGHGHKYWVYDDYDNRYAFGPDVPLVNIPRSRTARVESREEGSFPVTFVVD